MADLSLDTWAEGEKRVSDAERHAEALALLDGARALLTKASCRLLWCEDKVAVQVAHATVSATAEALKGRLAAR